MHNHGQLSNREVGIMAINSRQRWGVFAIGRFFAALLSLTVLSACHHTFAEEQVPAKCPIVITDNIVLCPPAKSCTPAALRQITCTLRHQAVQVVRVGEDMRVIIASDRLFNPNSANFNYEYLAVLKAVGVLMQCYDKEHVLVEGYTDCCGCEARNEKLSLAQANKVAKYLWEHGSDSRLLTTKGYGSLNPIANSNNYYGRARNRRIEIIFRDYPHWD